MLGLQEQRMTVLEAVLKDVNRIAVATHHIERHVVVHRRHISVIADHQRGQQRLVQLQVVNQIQVYGTN